MSTPASSVAGDVFARMQRAEVLLWQSAENLYLTERNIVPDKTLFAQFALNVSATHTFSRSAEKRPCF